jgi:hypothetical protein
MEPDGRSDDHRTFEDMAVAHVMGGLDDEQGRLFRAHLLDCGDCRARVGELRAIAHELAGVERDERRVRSAKAVEMKSREADGQEPPGAQRPRIGWVGRALILGGVTVVMLLGAYVFALRGQVAELETRHGQQIEASAALEHGRELSLIHTAPGVTDATAKRHGDQVVVLLEGLDDERVYGLYAVEESDGTSRTAYRELLNPQNGRLFVLFPLQGSEDRFIVTRPSNGFGGDPSGATVFEAHLDRYADE